MAARNIGKYQIYLVRESSHYPQFVVTCPQDVTELLINHCNILDSPVEQFIVIYLNNKNKVTGTEVVSKGGIASTHAEPRNVFMGAILQNAVSIIAAHNHPSGDPTPSEEDKRLTRRIREAGEILGIRLLDHIVVGDENNYFSFKEGGYLG